VFDAAGKCILTLHSPKDVVHPHRGLVRHASEAAENAGSSKGQKRSAKPLQNARTPRKKRRLAIEDSDEDGDSADEPLGSQKGRSHPPDRSMEGEYFIPPNATQNWDMGIRNWYAAIWFQRSWWVIYVAKLFKSILVSLAILAPDFLTLL
jgi:hypothetical protein